MFLTSSVLNGTINYMQNVGGFRQNIENMRSCLIECMTNIIESEAPRNCIIGIKWNYK